MLEIIIKKEFEQEKIAFGGSNSHLPLSERPDLAAIALLAQQTKNPNLLRFFEIIPTLEELEEEKADRFIEKTKKTKAIPKPEGKQKEPETSKPDNQAEISE